MMDRIQLEALRDAYQAARPVRTCSYGSRPWGIQTPEGSTLAGWRAPEGDLPGYEVICWRLKRKQKKKISRIPLAFPREWGIVSAS